MTVGESIKYFRKKNKLTQKQLAIKAGMAEITIRQYESGKREPRLEQLHKIAEALNVTVIQFYTADEQFAKEFEQEGEAQILDELTEACKKFLENDDYMLRGYDGNNIIIVDPDGITHSVSLEDFKAMIQYCREDVRRNMEKLLRKY